MTATGIAAVSSRYAALFWALSGSRGSLSHGCVQASGAIPLTVWNETCSIRRDRPSSTHGPGSTLASVSLSTTANLGIVDQVAAIAVGQVAMSNCPDDSTGTSVSLAF